MMFGKFDRSHITIIIHLISTLYCNVHHGKGEKNDMIKHVMFGSTSSIHKSVCMCKGVKIIILVIRYMHVLMIEFFHINNE